MKIKRIMENKTKFLWMLLFLFGGVMISWGQTVTGTVTSEDGALPGASIQVKGTSTGASTDFDGNYSIQADADATLVFSFVGFATKEVQVGNQTEINVVLEVDNALDEIVVIGYGTQRKSDLTGAVSTVSSEAITAVPTSRVDNLLQGRAAGVKVTQSTGAPGAAPVIRIRGGNSITGSNQPLWVIDGIIVGTDYDLNNLNGNDIKSIEILKDASSIAIYGSRGANGVMLVTTKSGSNLGKPQINVGFYAGTQFVPEKPALLNQPDQIEFTNESARFRNAAEPFPNDPSTYPDNDYFQLLIDEAQIYNGDVSIAGSSESGNVNYYNSLNLFKQEGIIQNSGISKAIFRSNIDIKISDKLKTGFRINYSRLHEDNGVVGYGSLLNILPTQPVYNEDGTYNGFNEVVGAPFSNPVAIAELDINETYTNNFLGSVYLEYSPNEKWIIRSTFNPEVDNTKTNRFWSSQRPDYLEVGQQGSARVATRQTFGWNNENTAQYTTNFNENHDLTVLGGASFQKFETETAYSRAYGITTDATTFNNLGLGSDPTRNEVGSGYSGKQLASFFGRVNYGYKNKYLLTLVGRYDGSSVFADGNKWAFFPSIAGAWKISEEDFMKDSNTFRDLKLRASYGRAGNQGIDSYRTLAIMEEASTTFGGTQNPGVVVGRPASPALQWETTTQFDIALEASMFDGRLFVELNYYSKKTDDLLLNVSIPKNTGFTSQLQNIGSLNNKGWEFLLNSTNITNDNFTWKSTLVLSQNKNEVTDLGGEEFIDVVVNQIIGSGQTRIILGEPVPVFTGVNYLGTWKSQEEIDASGLQQQVVGGPHYEDLNGDGIISNEDNVVLGSPQADLIFGFDNTFTYKNWDFSFFFQGTVGNEVYNLRTRGALFQRGETQKYAEMATDRWTEANPTGNLPRAGSDSVTQYVSNSEDVEDGSHLRLKTARLAYNFPVDKMGWGGVKNFSIYGTGSNLLLVSGFRLIDPETSRFGNTGLGNIAQGFSDGEYPATLTLSLGFNITF